MRSRRVLMALVVALGVSAMFTWWLGRRLPHAHAAVEPHATRVKYVVAVRALGAGDVLQADAVEVREWDGPVALDGAFEQASAVSGRVVLYPLAAGQPILARHLADAAEAGLAYRIPQGMRAISVKSNDVTGVSGFLLPGTHVDALLTYVAHDGTAGHTDALMEDVRVVAAGQKSEPDPQGRAVTSDVVTLLVTPEQALRLVTASAAGEIHFALRNGGDKAVHAVLPAQATIRSAGKAPRGGGQASGAVGTGAAIGYQVDVVSGDKQHTERF